MHGPGSPSGPKIKAGWVPGDRRRALEGLEEGLLKGCLRGFSKGVNCGCDPRGVNIFKAVSSEFSVLEGD